MSEQHTRQLKTDSDLWGREPNLGAVRQAHSLLKENPTKALADLKTLADNGSTMSKVYIGSAYLSGNGGVKDNSLAEKWFRDASQEGSIYASHELGKLYLEQGKIHEAGELFASCSALGYSPSTYQIALLYIDGRGVEKDLGKGRSLLELGARQGNMYARRTLAIYLIKGKFEERKVFKGALLFLFAFGGIINTAFRNPYSEKLRN